MVSKGGSLCVTLDVYENDRIYTVTPPLCFCGAVNKVG